MWQHIQKKEIKGTVVRVQREKKNYSHKLYVVSDVGER